jgi:glycosyltransferase involved in cell wall biosynthesis
MRVANVIEEGKLGGPQVRMVRVAAAMADRAETLIVMPRANSASFREMCEAHGVPYRRIPLTQITKQLRPALAYVVFSPFEVVRLARLFRRERVDIVHASGGSWQYKAVLAARLAGIPSVWHLNDTQMPGWVRRLFRLLQPMANAFIFTSIRVEAYYGRYITGNRPFAFVPPPVDVSHFDPSVTFPADDSGVSMFGADPVIGTIGNINPVKGLDTLIRAAANLRAMGYSPHVVIVGPISARQKRYYRRLRALADKLGLDRLHFVGARADVRPMLARFDVYVCSSVAESWGMALWEAMAMARPIVSTDVGDVSLHVVDGESGFIVPVGDDAAMADRISRLLDEPDLRACMGRGARDASRIFSPEAVGRQTVELYAQVSGCGKLAALSSSAPAGTENTNEGSRE